MSYRTVGIIKMVGFCKDMLTEIFIFIVFSSIEFSKVNEERGQVNNFKLNY